MESEQDEDLEEDDSFAVIKRQEAMLLKKLEK
jgi:hypothetical protein